jgi:enoyl-CoA hydratase
VYSYISKDIDALGVCTITLNRPPVNAVSQQMYAEIHHAFASLNPDLEVKVAILTGAGDRAFCGGNDLKEFESMDMFNADERMRVVREAFFAIYDCAVPVIGAINGPAIGTGVGLSANCDILIASDRASFQLPEINVGVLGGGAFGARMAGQFVMRRMFFTGEAISADDMMRHGAVSYVVSHDELIPFTREIAEGIAGRSGEAVRLAKYGINLCEPMDHKSGYTLEQSFTARLSSYPAAKEALASIRERRAPDFRSLPPHVDPVEHPKVQ